MDKNLGPKRKVPGTSTSKQAPKNKKQQVRPIHHYFAKETKQSKDSNGDGIHGNEPQPAEAETEYGQDHCESSAHASSDDNSEGSQAEPEPPAPAPPLAPPLAAPQDHPNQPKISFPGKAMHAQYNYEPECIRYLM